MGTYAVARHSRLKRMVALGSWGALAVSISGCMIKINHLEASASAQSLVSVSSPAADNLSAKGYRVFAGTCSPSAGVVTITYPASSGAPLAWGPSSTPCTASGTFAVGLHLTGNTSGTRTLQFSQAGSAPILRTVSYSVGGINGLATGFDDAVNALAWDAARNQLLRRRSFHQLWSVRVQASGQAQCRRLARSHFRSDRRRI